jgi:hypothetical protein
MIRRTVVCVFVVAFVMAGIAMAQVSTPLRPQGSYAIKLVTPRTGTKWLEHSTQTVKWEVYSQVPPDSVQIKLATGQSESVLVTYIKENPGSWEWVNVTPASNKLKMTAVAYFPDQVTKTSSHPFIITPAAGTGEGSSGRTKPAQDADVTVIIPNGGESWTVGATEMISWGLQLPQVSPKETLDILLSRDGGKTYPETITTGLSMDNLNYKWTVTGPASKECRVKVIVAGTSGLLPAIIEDASDADFAITVMPTKPGE